MKESAGNFTQRIKMIAMDFTKIKFDPNKVETTLSWEEDDLCSACAEVPA